jgi:pyruvate/2-oxoglutarate dehydrogenase complex dihydrolipoamide acyltransferase (E2) component
VKAVTMPALGVAMSEGLLLGWLKSTGDAVAEGEPLMEIETDKSTMEIPSPAAGVVGPLLFEPGALVPVGVTMTHIVEAADSRDGAADAGADPTGPVRGAERPTDGSEPSKFDDRAAPTVATVAGTGERTPHRLSPRERRMARERDGATDGSVAELDAPAIPATPPAAPDPATASPSGGRHRALIAAKVSESWRTIPHFAVTREVDAAAMVAVRDRRAIDRPGFTALMVKALALALREGGEAGPVDVGLAVATRDGVAIPVIRGVLALDLPGLQRETDAAISRARDGRLRPSDVTEPPRSTLSNLGPQGIDSFTGVIASGQTSILTVGRIHPRPTVANGIVSVRDSFVATLNVDHRVLDGDDAARLLMAFVGAIEDADRLETEVLLA